MDKITSGYRFYEHHVMSSYDHEVKLKEDATEEVDFSLDLKNYKCANTDNTRAHNSRHCSLSPHSKLKQQNNVRAHS